MLGLSDAYAAAGVHTDQADAGVGALVGVLRTIELGRPSRSSSRAATTRRC
jgi:phosphoribosylformylglycinamidine cyclo-ligase